jgi:hypothetical protein
MKKLRVEKEFPYDKIGSFRMMNPFMILFVYPKNFSPFVVKGGSTSVDGYIKRKYEKEPMLINRTYWRHGRHRSFWTHRNIPDVHIDFSFIRHNIKKYGRPYVITELNSDKVIAKMRRIPRKWIKELNPYV